MSGKIILLIMKIILRIVKIILRIMKIILRIMKTILLIAKNICILFERLCKARVKLYVKWLEGTNVECVRTFFRTRNKPYISDGFEVRTIHSQPV